MNNPDHISASLVTISWVKILKFFDADPGSGMEKNSDPQHCLCGRWYLKLKCASCGEVPDHFQYITQTEKQPLKGSTAT
jgi:hypothetical protein